MAAIRRAQGRAACEPDQLDRLSALFCGWLALAFWSMLLDWHADPAQRARLARYVSAAAHLDRLRRYAAQIRPSAHGCPAADAGEAENLRDGAKGPATSWRTGCPNNVEAKYAGRIAPPDGEAAVAQLFAARYAEMVRLAGLLGADDAEDVAQEAFARLLDRRASLRDPGAAIGYVRSTVCNLTRNRKRHLGIARLLAPPGLPEAGATLEQAVIVREDHGEVLAAVASLPRRQREAVVLRYWLELSEVEIAATMGIAAGTVKSLVSRGVASVGKRLEALK